MIGQEERSRGARGDVPDNAAVPTDSDTTQRIIPLDKQSSSFSADDELG